MDNSLYLIVGLGASGRSVAAYLRRKALPFMVFDTRKAPPDLELFKKDYPSIPLYLESFPLSLLDSVTDLIVSPGLALDTPLLVEAGKRGLSIYGDIECLAREIKAPVLAITGTNGKSTVTTLVGEMAKASGFRVAVAGNIGNPVLSFLEDAPAYDLWVLELSSFQLELTMSLKPMAACILNVTPDHLDRHQSMQAYTAAKQRIYQHAEKKIFYRADPATYPEALTHGISFGSDEPGPADWGLRRENAQLFLAKGEELLIAADALQMKGEHNWLNALAACALAEAASCSQEAILSVLTHFSGLPHRCQFVRRLDEVLFIDDSKGTNVGATLSAIKGIASGMQGKIVLIAGGLAKGADFSDLAPAAQQHLRSLILIGKDAAQLDAALGALVHTVYAGTMMDAVLAAKAAALPGDVVLLSPACASLDMFRDFNHRGDEFISSVNGL